MKISQKGSVPPRRRLAAVLVLLALVTAACRLVTGQAGGIEATQAADPAGTNRPAVIGSPTLERDATETAKQPAQSPTPGETAASTPLIPVSSEGPAAALLPEAQADLSNLEGVSEYDIELQIDASLASFRGQMSVSYTNREDRELEQVYFRLLPNGGKSYGNGALAVTAVSLNGQALQNLPAQDDPSVLEIPLPASLQPGGRSEFDFEFNGQVPQDFGGGGEPSGYGIYNLTGGVLALSGWYPILSVYDEDGWNLDPVSDQGDSVYSDTAFYSVKICAPSDVVIAATGVQTVEEPGDTTCRQHESGPTRDFMLMGSRDYQVLTAEADGTTIRSYYRQGHQQAAQKVLDISVRSLEIFNEKFGPYPFTELDVMDAPMRNALGVEFPGIILVASSLYDEPDREDLAVTTAHEVGHQWWYSVVGNDVFEEPWLDEALTTFTSTLYYEYGRSSSEAQRLWDFWEERYDRTAQSGRDDPVTETLTYFETDPANRSYATIVYVKGGLFFNALRQEIGDDAFFGALQQYYRENKYDIARAEDLLNAFEAAAGRQLDDFYQQWLY